MPKFLKILLSVFLISIPVLVIFFIRSSDNEPPAIPSERERPGVLTEVTPTHFMKLFHGFIQSPNSTSALENWAWRNDMVLVKVLEVLPKTSELAVNMSVPRNQPFSDVNMIIPVSCDKNKSMLFSSTNLTFLDSRIDIFSEAQPEDFLYTYCMDSGCTELGVLCVLMRDITDE